MQQTRFSRDSLGLRVMLAALVSIAAVLILAFGYQITSDTDAVRVRGINLARLVTELSNTEQPEASWKKIFTHQLTDSHFAYGTIIDPSGAPMVQVAASGIIVPTDPLPGANSWLQESSREVRNHAIIEFFGPLRIAGGTGHFRIGFYEPSWAPTLESVPFAASLILPVFLLAPVFLFFIKREVTPLKKVNTELSRMLQSNSGEAPLLHTGTDLRAFVDQFNRFIDQAKAQIGEYQEEKSKLVTSEKFLGYRLNRHESVLNSLPDALLVLDQDSTVSFANLRIKELLDVEPDALIGEKVAANIQIPALHKYFVKHEKNPAGLVGESVTFNAEHRPDASLQAAAFRLGNDGNHLVVIRDVSKESRAQQSRSEFVAHLAHELKAPLHTLALYSEALQDQLDSEEFRLEASNVIKDEVERLARLISNLLSMTQIEMGTLEMDRQRIKLVDLVRDATEAMERSARGKELTFELDLPREVTPVLVDKDLLRIAINNLLTNAIKYTEEQGNITVSVTENDDAVTVCVADTGIGIPEDEQAQIFHKFYRASSEEVQSRSGHGLGLPLARDIVELHHGSIRVESEPGVGSRFYIDLWKQSGIAKQAI